MRGSRSLAVLLARDWAPLGPDAGVFVNALFVVVVASAVLGSFALFRRHYAFLLRLFLENRAAFLATPGPVPAEAGESAR